MSFGKRELNTRTSLQVIHLNSLTPQLDNNHHINLDAHHAQNLWITLWKVSFQIWPMHIYIIHSHFGRLKIHIIRSTKLYILRRWIATICIVTNKQQQLYLIPKKKKKEEQQFLYHVENSSTCSSLLYRWRFMEWGHKPTLLQAPSFSLKNS